MERSDPVTHILARIMMRMERCDESLLESIGPFESVAARGEAMAPVSPRQAYSRRRAAQANRDPMRRQPRGLEPEIFAPVVAEDSVGTQN